VTSLPPKLQSLVSRSMAPPEDLLQRIAALEAQMLSLTQASEADVAWDDQSKQDIDTSWLIITSTIVFLMQLGFAMLEGGMCRQNNVVATYAKNILDVVTGSLVTYFWGFYLAYGIDPRHTNESIDMANFFHHLVFQATSATIVSGAMAERTTLFAYVVLACFVSGVPFSIAVRWTWGGGWLSELDPPFHDFAGSTVVHVVGGMSAIVGVFIVGPRSGRYDVHRHHDFVPNDVASVLSGVLVLWVGWYGFNPGSTGALKTPEDVYAAANSAITTTMSAATGAVCTMVLSIIRGHVKGDQHSVDAVAIGNGVLAGLVSVTAGSDILHADYSLVLGFGGAFAYTFGSIITESLQLDDVVEAWAVHGCCGVWGTLAVGLFHPQVGLWTTGQSGLLWNQIVGVVSISLLTLVTMIPVGLLLSSLGYMRVKPEEEARGLDYKFGNAASSYITQKNHRLRACFLTLDAYGCSVDELLAALKSLKHIIMLPFSPQASDAMIEAQVSDVLSRFPEVKDGTDWDWLAFLSHHKSDAGDAARIFVDTARRIIEQAELEGAAHAKADHLDSLELLASLSSSAATLSSASATPPRQRRVSNVPLGADATLPSTMKRQSTRRFSGVTKGPTQVFLDSNDLTDLKQLISHVKSSANHVIMLSRATLERPYVLCELAVAYAHSKHITVVRVDWPGETDSLHGRTFSFPRHLDEAIEEWEEVAYFQRARSNEKDMEYRPLDGVEKAIRRLVAKLSSGEKLVNVSDASNPLSTAAALCMRVYSAIERLVGRGPGRAYEAMPEEHASLAAVPAGGSLNGTPYQPANGKPSIKPVTSSDYPDEESKKVVSIAAPGVDNKSWHGQTALQKAMTSGMRTPKSLIPAAFRSASRVPDLPKAENADAPKDSDAPSDGDDDKKIEA